MGCCPVSSRLITIHLRAVPFNITVVHACAQKFEYEDNRRNSVTSYKMSLIGHQRRTVLLYKEPGMQKWAGMRMKTGLTLLKFAKFNDLVLANTFGLHKASRRSTWQSRYGQHYNQIDYIQVRRHFRSGVNNVRPQSLQAADNGSENNLLKMTFHLDDNTSSINEEIKVPGLSCI